MFEHDSLPSACYNDWNSSFKNFDSSELAIIQLISSCFTDHSLTILNTEICHLVINVTEYSLAQ